MKKSLAEINGVTGVRGSFICDNRGAVIAGDAPPGLDAETLDAIGREVVQMMVALQSAGEPTGELDLQYERGGLVARDLDTAILIVLCQMQADLALLRLTINVAVARLKQDKAAQRQLAARAVERG